MFQVFLIACALAVVVAHPFRPQLAAEDKAKVAELTKVMKDPTSTKAIREAAFTKFLTDNGIKADFDKVVADIKAAAPTISSPNAKKFVETCIAMYDNKEVFDSPQNVKQAFDDAKTAAKLTDDDKAALKKFGEQYKDQLKTMFMHVFPHSSAEVDHDEE